MLVTIDQIHEKIPVAFRKQPSNVRIITVPRETMIKINVSVQWRTQEFCLAGGGEGSTNSVEDRANGDPGAVAT